MKSRPDYSKWSADELVERVAYLEQQLKGQTITCKSPRAALEAPSPPAQVEDLRVHREFDPSKYATRLIALKFAYLGQRYNGLEFHVNNKTRLPTVEEKLWQALDTAKLILPEPHSNPLRKPGEPNWEGCQYSKCGRTDKGVSAFGQVIGIRVRSNSPVSRVNTPISAEGAAVDEALQKPSQKAEIEMLAQVSASDDPLADDEEAKSFHPIDDEIPYCQILNRLLPPDILALAWCPAPTPDFSARFACRERRYKYFFTQPAFTPTIDEPGLRDGLGGSDLHTGRRRDGYLDIEAMREAARKFIGVHDFRNFCKVDPSKQNDNFMRQIYHADIEELDPHQHPVGYVGKPGFQQYEDLNEAAGLHLDDFIRPKPLTPTVYTLTVHGSAFLWHQVRHMVSILFLIGQGLEQSSLIDDFLDVKRNPCKPKYEMADDAPLVLWECIFPKDGSNSREDSMNWIYVGDYTGEEGGMLRAGFIRGVGKHGLGGIVNSMWTVWRKRKMDEVLAGTLLDVIVGQGRGDALDRAERTPNYIRSQGVFQGGDAPRSVGKYIPMLEKPRLESVEKINLKYALKKGFEQREEIRAQGFRRLIPNCEDNGNI